MSESPKLPSKSINCPPCSCAIPVAHHALSSCLLASPMRVFNQTRFLRLTCPFHGCSSCYIESSHRWEECQQTSQRFKFKPDTQDSAMTDTWYSCGSKTSSHYTCWLQSSFSPSLCITWIAILLALATSGVTISNSTLCVLLWMYFLANGIALYNWLGYAVCCTHRRTQRCRFVCPCFVAITSCIEFYKQGEKHNAGYNVVA